MSKVEINFDGLNNLYQASLRNGTLQHWAPIALEWAEHAEKEIARLNDVINTFKAEREERA